MPSVRMWLVLWTLNPHWCYDQMEVLYPSFHRNLEELLKCIFRSLLVMFWCFEMTRLEILTLNQKSNIC